MGRHEHRPAPVEMGSGRLEAFSDGVMAVIITILALTLHRPDAPTFEALRRELPQLAVYVLAFTFIAIYWNNHHHLLRATERISAGVMWSNMYLLFCLSLIPVVTEWIQADGSAALPAASFGIVALLAASAYTALVRTIVHANGKDSRVAAAVTSDVKGNISLVAYAVGVGLAYLNVWVAYTVYAAVAVMWMIPDRRFTRAQEP
jgi:uncharacterized membrane protein